MRGGVVGEEPALTALMPVRDYADPYLDEAIGSMVAQTSPDWRLLIIDESQDDTAPAARALRRWIEDERITRVANEGPRLAGAINTGMQHATTEFVALLLADDRWTLDAVEALTRRIRAAPDVDYFHSARRIIDDDGHAISSVHPPTDGVTLCDFFERNPVKHLLCWRRSFALAIGGLDERSPSVGPDDMDFPWKMAEHGARFEAIADCLYEYRDHRRTRRLTTHLPLRVHTREHRRILRKHGMNREQINARVAEARRTFLQQCLFRSRLDERIRTRLGLIPAPWRDTYR